MLNNAQWSDKDDAESAAQGWGLFETSEGQLELQRLDEKPAFTTDLEAWQHVVTRADAGNALCRKALVTLWRVAPRSDWPKLSQKFSLVGFD